MSQANPPPATPARLRPTAGRHVALRFAYDGARFAAYARDPAGGTVEDALLAALRTEGYVEDSFRTGSRTDARVSALENVCSARLERTTLRGLVPALQRSLPDGLWVTAAAQVPDAFNPRHAVRRRYGYVAVARGERLDPMVEACAAFVGRNDMRAFAKMEEGRDPLRNVFAFTVGREQNLDAARPAAWRFAVEGDGFLWNQVRRMVSAVLCVGRGEAQVADIRASLGTGVPHKSFRLAAADGLVLERVVHEGLEWDPVAGRLDPKRIPREVQQAHVRARLADHLQQLAPWPASVS